MVCNATCQLVSIEETLSAILPWAHLFSREQKGLSSKFRGNSWRSVSRGKCSVKLGKPLTGGRGVCDSRMTERSFVLFSVSLSLVSGVSRGEHPVARGSSANPTRHHVRSVPRPPLHVYAARVHYYLVLLTALYVYVSRDTLPGARGRITRTISLSPVGHPFLLCPVLILVLLHRSLFVPSPTRSFRWRNP